jgi:hypothetical protein
MLDACRVSGVISECGAPLVVWVGKLDTEELVGGGDLFILLLLFGDAGYIAWGLRGCRVVGW